MSAEIIQNSIEIIEVKTKRQLTKFILLPAKIHKNHKNWVPPIYMDDRLFFNFKKNKSFSYCDTILLLALKGKNVVGRIMGIINHRYNDAHDDKDGRFGFMETYEDPEVANLLMNTLENWAIKKGMKRIVGPLGFSDKDPQGMLIQGFDETMVIATNCNFPYQVRLIEDIGFKKKTDLVVYKLNIPDEVPEIYKKVYERGVNGNNVQVIDLQNKKQLKPYIIPVLKLMNITFKDIYAFAPMDENEMIDYANRYLSILDPKFIKLVLNKEKEVVAFVIGMPDISEGIKRSKGRIFPFGILKILYHQKRTKQLNLLLGGIREDYQNKGLNAIMGVKMLEEAHKAGLKYIDSHLELEDNLKVRAEMERLGGVVYKTYRIYQKPLNVNH
ncbi:hypothetical protein ACFLTE_03100 [Bacteroidota bacterium]